MRSLLRVAACAACLLFLNGCLAAVATYAWLYTDEVRVQTVALNVAERANENSPVAVDMVFLSKRLPLLDEVQKMTAADWFAKRAQLVRDFRDDIEVVSWEVVPGQILPAESVPTVRARSAAFVFAGYRAPGAHRYRVGSERTLLLSLGANELTVTPK
jgi:type VI secretion system protein